MDFVLDQHRIPKCPDSAFYIPEFISVEEEKLIIHNLAKVPNPKWTQLSARRLINFGGVPHPKLMIAEELPAWLQLYLDKLNSLGIFNDKKANHCLLNEYLAGQGIMPHLDGSLYYPVIATISSSAHTVLEFQRSLDDQAEHPEQDKLICKLLVEPRSLLVLKDDMYEKYLHSIAERTEDTIDEHFVNVDFEKQPMGSVLQREKRISLTIRHVPKTSKMKLKINF